MKHIKTVSIEASRHKAVQTPCQPPMKTAADALSLTSYQPLVWNLPVDLLGLECTQFMV